MFRTDGQHLSYTYEFMTWICVKQEKKQGIEDMMACYNF